ncbi:hypothetical protein ABBQ38_014514 [Trebouxia sp. C0009 RCD-2024]
MNKGGSKPVFKGAPSACLTAFGAMVQDKRKELLAGNMHDYYKAEPKTLQADAKAVALKEWKLLDEEHRSVYQERAAADQLRWEKDVEQYEHRYPHYRSHLAQKHVKKLNDKGVIDVQLSQLGIRKPFTARHYYIKEQVEKRVTYGDTPTGDMADLFEEISNAKRKAWLDMDDSGKKKYEKLAEEDKQRFEGQLQAHPRLAAMIAAYDEKQQGLRALKKGKSHKSSRGPNKRKVREGSQASDDEGEDNAQGMDVDGAGQQPAKQQRHPLAELAQAEVPEGSTAAAVEGADAQQAPEADEQVSDTDNEDEDDADFGGDLLETVQETQNDEEEQALTGSQASTLKQRLGMQKFGSFIAGLFTARKPANKESGAGKDQPSQPDQSAIAPAAAVPEAEKEDDDMPPIHNTLDSQASAAAVEEKPLSPTAAPAGPAATPELPQQSLVDKLNEVAEGVAVLPAAAGTEDSSIAFVTTPGLAEGIQTTTGAAGKAGTAAAEPTADEVIGEENGKSSAQEETVEPGENTRPSRAAKVAASAKIASSTSAASGGKRASTASRPSAENRRAASGGRRASTASRHSAEKKKAAAVAEAPADSTNKENDQAAPPTVAGQEASHMAVKEPHSRVTKAQGSKAGSPTGAASSKKNKKAGKDKQDPLIGRCVKKAFDTENGSKTYTGWVIGKHATKNWYAVQYEDGDKEEFVLSELRKKKNMLQPAGVEERNDYEELDRLYAQAQAEWATEEVEDGGE